LVVVAQGEQARLVMVRLVATHLSEVYVYLLAAVAVKV
jgi:hypothetical protein